MYQPKYNPNFIIEDLKNHNVDITLFKQKVIDMGAPTSQAMFEFIYECVKINNYNMSLFI